jgi:hypothetical protein
MYIYGGDIVHVVLDINSVLGGFTGGSGFFYSAAFTQEMRRRLASAGYHIVTLDDTAVDTISGGQMLVDVQTTGDKNDIQDVASDVAIAAQGGGYSVNTTVGTLVAGQHASSLATTPDQYQHNVDDNDAQHTAGWWAKLAASLGLTETELTLGAVVVGVIGVVVVKGRV